jgi:hypothetical protein
VRVRLVLLLYIGACDKAQVNADTGRVVADTAATRSASEAPVRPACRPTGQWTECSVFERLDRAGLAPRRDSSGASEAPLTPKGLLYKVGASDLEVYLYENAEAREKQDAALDRTKYLEYPAPLTMKREPTLIRSANLIAILHSRNDHQRERVSDAITAGPPQPQKP